MAGTFGSSRIWQEMVNDLKNAQRQDVKQSQKSLELQA
jgi:hypothetical protein